MSRRNAARCPAVAWDDVVRGSQGEGAPEGPDTNMQKDAMREGPASTSSLVVVVGLLVVAVVGGRNPSVGSNCTADESDSCSAWRTMSAHRLHGLPSEPGSTA